MRPTLRQFLEAHKPVNWAEYTNVNQWLLSSPYNDNLSDAIEPRIYLTWIERSHKRLESETQPDLIDHVDVTKGDPKGEAIDVACELQEIMDIARVKILEHMASGFAISMLIEQNGMAAMLLYAAPRKGFCSDMEENLIKKLDHYAEGAKLSYFLNKMAYIDQLWFAKPGTMKKSLAQISQ